MHPSLSPYFYLPLCWLFLLSTPLARSQDQFQLVAPNLGTSSTALLTHRELIIRDAHGSLTSYLRNERLDSQDGAWAGYFSNPAQQAIRWPLAGQSHFEIGTPDNSGRTHFRPSQMRIVFIPPNQPNNSVLPQNPAPSTSPSLSDPTAIQLVQRNPNQQFLSLLDDGSLSLFGQAFQGPNQWTMVPVSPGIVRLQIQHQNQWAAMTCSNRGRSIHIAPLANAPSQLWRWQAFPSSQGGYFLESIQFPGQALAFFQGQLLLQPIGFLPEQQWFPLLPTPTLNPTLPSYRATQSHVLPNPPLPPALVDLRNNSPEAITVILADRRPDGLAQTIRIPPGQAIEVSLERDAGSTIVESFESLNALGDWARQEHSIPIPPQPIYDLSVYQEFLQSIAIDRTGKSPNPIEDINYQPKSIGWFVFPPGEKLPVRGMIDVMKQAQAANNPGATRPLNPDLLKNQSAPIEDPLKAILRDAQSRRAPF